MFHIDHLIPGGVRHCPSVLFFGGAVTSVVVAVGEGPGARLGFSLLNLVLLGGIVHCETGIRMHELALLLLCGYLLHNSQPFGRVPSVPFSKAALVTSSGIKRRG